MKAKHQIAPPSARVNGGPPALEVPSAPSDLEKVRPGDYEAEQKVWDAFAEILRAKGLDPGKASAKWAEGQAKKLTTMEARNAFERLCAQGCVPQVLATILVLIRYAPGIETYWTQIMGHAQDRQKASRSLEKTARTLEGLLAEIVNMENEQARKIFSKIGHIPPSQLISELRFYAQYLNVFELLTRESRTRSLHEVCRYVLASYVKGATGRYRDSETSALVAELCGPLDYNDVAQRMWRLRNYKRLDRIFSIISDFSLAAGVVIVRST
jgi:hypothetical protein